MQIVYVACTVHLERTAFGRSYREIDEVLYMAFPYWKLELLFPDMWDNTDREIQEPDGKICENDFSVPLYYLKYFIYFISYIQQYQFTFSIIPLYDSCDLWILPYDN
jgi:hypothetical protein